MSGEQTKNGFKSRESREGKGGLLSSIPTFLKIKHYTATHTSSSSFTDQIMYSIYFLSKCINYASFIPNLKREGSSFPYRVSMIF